VSQRLVLELPEHVFYGVICTGHVTAVRRIMVSNVPDTSKTIGFSTFWWPKGWF